MVNWVAHLTGKPYFPQKSVMHANVNIFSAIFFIYQVYWNLRLLSQFYYSKSANYSKVNWTIKIDGSLHWLQTFTNNFSRNYWIWINFSKNREKEKLRNCNAIKTFWLITSNGKLSRFTRPRCALSKKKINPKVDQINDKVQLIKKIGLNCFG